MSSRRRLEDAVGRMHEPFGGMLCLDFANTLEPRGGPPPLEWPSGVDMRDELTSYVDLVAWAVHKDTLDAHAAVGIIDAADADSHGAEEALGRAHALRDVIYRAFWQLAEGGTPTREDLAVIMREYADASAHAGLVVSENSVEWDWSGNGTALARPLWAVARSAVHLLTTGDRQRIKVCPGLGRPPLACAWLFYDATKNGSRRWCSMADCGAASKAQIQTARRRASRTAPSS